MIRLLLIPVCRITWWIINRHQCNNNHYWQENGWPPCFHLSIMKKHSPSFAWHYGSRLAPGAHRGSHRAGQTCQTQPDCTTCPVKVCGKNDLYSHPPDFPVTTEIRYSRSVRRCSDNFREGANKSLIWDHVCHLEPWNRVHHESSTYLRRQWIQQ